MAQGNVDLQFEGRIARIEFSNPDDGLMDETMEAEFLRTIEFVRTAGPAVCILSGATPGYFIRHYDLKVLERRAEKMAQKDFSFSADRPVPEGAIHTAMRLMEESGTVFIAALNGTAMGGGFEIALACDFRLVEKGPYQFGLPEINLGLLPGAGGTQRLPRLVGLARALEITLLGGTLDGEAMVATGLATGPVQDNAVEAATRMANRIAAQPDPAPAHIKQLVRRAAGPSAEDAGFGAERALFCDLMLGARSRELVREGAAGRRSITDLPDS
ncbi:enoyl-CoA hydratase/isomerase family protein [Lutimaribacter marinistellae]|uniref:Enoyl-CoA hydratase/isomerase family protein n=1 Tax=Lutimaribacter marinistellae TaxID=1820329 RepID=A0ABV7THZ6_9RHOB